RQGAEEVAELVRAAGGEALTIKADVGQREGAEGVVRAAAEAWGCVDVLVNNAGITRDALVLRMKPEQWDEVIQVNLSGVFFASQAAAKLMAKQRRGRIVNVASVVGLAGNPGQANYAAAKGGVIAMTKVLAREFASRGVTANSVAPGFIVSDMTSSIDPKYEAGILATIPL
ncbi:short chain dehydrogenase, partial [Helicosporidium sp. ATCC 50920]